MKASYALCITVTGAGIHTATNLYTCDTTKNWNDRCTIVSTITHPHSCCTLGLIHSTIAGEGDDTGVECIIDSRDFTIHPYILNACSYAANTNSAPGSCARTDECKQNSDCLDIPDCLKGTCTAGVCTVTPNNAACGAATTCHSTGVCQANGQCTRTNYPGTVCRSADGGCDIAEHCDNSNPSVCPADGYQADMNAEVSLMFVMLLNLALA